MNRSLQALRDLLAPLRLYRLDGRSYVDGELRAYAAAFALLEDQLDALADGLFPQTAEGNFLALHQQLVGLPVRDSAPAASRRALILARRAVGPASTLEELLAAAGILAPRASREGDILTISPGGFAPGLTEEQVWALAEQLLPAHLNWRPGEVLPPPADPDWIALDAQDHTWTAADTRDLDWIALGLTV